MQLKFRQDVDRRYEARVKYDKRSPEYSSRYAMAPRPDNTRIHSGTAKLISDCIQRIFG
jgi:hypothetical protein